MKACVLEAVGELHLKDVPIPKPKAGEVLLKIRACGICSSDIDRIFKTGTYHFPTIPGHEISGEIVELGEGVDKALLNQCAVVFPLLPCFHCPSCSVGEYARCDQYSYFGSRCDGGFAEYLAVPVWNLSLFSRGLSFPLAAMCEPAAVALHAINEAQIRPGDTVSIVGSGTIGLLAAMWAKICGAGLIILIGRGLEKLKYAQSIGLGKTVSIQEQDPVAAIYEATSGKGVDVAMEFVGTSGAISTAISAAKKGGSVILTGNPVDEIRLERSVYWKILRNELSLRGTWNSKHNVDKNDWNITLKYISDGMLNPESLISHRITLENVSLAFEMLRSRKDIIKVVLEM